MHRSRFGVVVGGLAVCAAGLAASAFAFGSANASIGAAKKPTTIVVKATEFKFALSKTSVPVGTTVVFKVVNRGKIGHDFKINGKKTPMIAAGKSATLKVVFKKKGKFVFDCDIPGHAAAGMKGTFGVGVSAPKPPPTPTTTTTTAYPGPGGTVTVNEFEFGFTLSPTVVPSGNVTFVMKNTGTVSHNFDIEGVAGGSGAFIDPGQTATMTVNLQAGRTYTYVCDVPYHAGEGMEGTFVPQG
jgi:nitrite reductase (NO-forming)